MLEAVTLPSVSSCGAPSTQLGISKSVPVLPAIKVERQHTPARTLRIDLGANGTFLTGGGALKSAKQQSGAIDQPEAGGRARWDRAGGLVKEDLRAERAARKTREREHLWEIKRAAKRAANESFTAGEIERTVQQLDECIRVCPGSDVLHRYRMKAHLRRGEGEAALRDSEKAIEIDPGDGRNWHAQGQSLYSNRKLREAGDAFLSATRLGCPGTSRALGYSGLLNTIRRERSFSHLPRPLVSRVLGGCAGRTGVSIFDPRKLFDDSMPPEPGVPEPPRLRMDAVACTSAKVCWALAEQPGGLIIRRLTLQLSRHEVVWEEKQRSFFDGFREFESVHQGTPQAASSFTLEQLRPDTEYRLRICCKGDRLESPWSDVVAFRTLAQAAPGAAEAKLPRSWLHVDLSDLVEKQNRLCEGGCTAATFFAEIAKELENRVTVVRKVFKHYCASGLSAMAAGVPTMSLQQFSRFVRDTGVSDETAHGASASPAGLRAGESLAITPEAPQGAQRVKPDECDLIFQRANVEPGSLQRRGASRGGDAAQGVSEVAEVALEGIDATIDANEEAGGDGGANKLVISEFVGGLVRLAWVVYPEGGQTGGGGVAIGERLGTFLERAVQPLYARLSAVVDPLDEVMRSKRVQAVLDYYEPRLREAFDCYAQADQKSAGAMASLSSLNLPELVFMLKEGKMLNEHLTMSHVSQVFNQVNSRSAAEEGGDDDEQELDFDEFRQVLPRLCYIKIPAASREGPFEDTLQAWLQLMWCPTYKKLLSDKKRGISSKTL